uniref:Uncharacterized protein n=1 Tax=Magnetococcus massalia (strain MO-1) TaxID=451514 RepID=A0A1S7LKS3_MAGMO|nr:conserved protein of unknown function [Candidatus Magnetococcus massalia]
MADKCQQQGHNPVDHIESAGQAGFTLIELSMVLVIVGLIISAGISLLPGTMDTVRLRETRGILKEMRQAVEGYAAVHKRLPCPDSDTTPDGLENTQQGRCAKATGFFPHRTLGVSNGVDAWGFRVVYGLYQNSQLSLGQSQTPNLCSNMEKALAAGIPTVNDVVRIGMGRQDPKSTIKLNYSCEDKDTMAMAFVLLSPGPSDADMDQKSDEAYMVYTGKFDGMNENPLGEMAQSSCFDPPERGWFMPDQDKGTKVNPDSYNDVVEAMGLAPLIARLHCP